MLQVVFISVDLQAFLQIEARLLAEALDYVERIQEDGYLERVNTCDVPVLVSKDGSIVLHDNPFA